MCILFIFYLLRITYYYSTFTFTLTFICIWCTSIPFYSMLMHELENEKNRMTNLQPATDRCLWHTAAIDINIMALWQSGICNAASDAYAIHWICICYAMNIWYWTCQSLWSFTSASAITLTLMYIYLPLLTAWDDANHSSIYFFLHHNFPFDSTQQSLLFADSKFINLPMYIPILLFLLMCLRLSQFTYLFNTTKFIVCRF